MAIRVLEVYSRVLASLNKEEAPAILISDFNYFWNKATIHYINERYNLYDTNQQTTDDLSTLVESELLLPNSYLSPFKTMYLLPLDYLHLLRCEVYFAKKTNAKCAPKKNIDILPGWVEMEKHTGSIIMKHTRRDTAETHSGAEQNYYFKPSLDNPYHFIRSVSFEKLKQLKELNPDVENWDNWNADENNDEEEDMDGTMYHVLEIRAGNTIGKNPLKDEIVSVEVEYLRKPKEITLTRGQIKGGELSEILEFPDYVLNEIVNRCVILLEEKASDPRLQTTVSTHQTIPAQATG